MKHMSRENWVNKNSSFTAHKNNKELIEKLKQNKELQKRINKFIVL